MSGRSLLNMVLQLQEQQLEQAPLQVVVGAGAQQCAGLSVQPDSSPQQKCWTKGSNVIFSPVKGNVSTSWDQSSAELAKQQPWQSATFKLHMWGEWSSACFPFFRSCTGINSFLPLRLKDSTRFLLHRSAVYVIKNVFTLDGSHLLFLLHVSGLSDPAPLSSCSIFVFWTSCGRIILLHRPTDVKLSFCTVYMWKTAQLHFMKVIIAELFKTLCQGA